MNNERRKRIDKIFSELSKIESELIQLGDEEFEAFENLPESLQLSEKGEQMDRNADALQCFAQELAGLVGELDELTQ